MPVPPVTLEERRVPGSGRGSRRAGPRSGPRWYEERLDLAPYEVWPEPGLLRDQIGTHFSIYLSPNAGTAKNTVASFIVSDLRAEVATPRARGVAFEEYDLGVAQTVDGVAEDEREGSFNAWFTDWEGNVLVLAQDVPLAAG